MGVPNVHRGSGQREGGSAYVSNDQLTFATPGSEPICYQGVHKWEVRRPPNTGSAVLMVMSDFQLQICASNAYGISCLRLESSTDCLSWEKCSH